MSYFLQPGSVAATKACRRTCSSWNSSSLISGVAWSRLSSSMLKSLHPLKKNTFVLDSATVGIFFEFQQCLLKKTLFVSSSLRTIIEHLYFRRQIYASS
ncbi:UNVERIFIED_CONTAM: hypothetical protein NCL1_26920 [Trichonephila clavipes]